MKKFIVVMMVMAVMAMAFTGCKSDTKSHRGHLATREVAKADMFDGGLLCIK